MQAELRPRGDLGEFLEGPEAAWESDEAIGQGSHLGLALVEGLDHALLGQAAVGKLAIDQRTRDHADDLSAGRQGSIGDGAHHPDPPTAVDEADPALRQ
jgi:hypothetical protein